VTALFLLCQVFLIITHSPLVRALARILLEADGDIFTERGAAKIAVFSGGSSSSSQQQSQQQQVRFCLGF